MTHTYVYCLCVCLLCKGAHVAVYGGELVTKEEAQRRKRVNNCPSTSYFLQIPRNQQYVVDGYQFAKDVNCTHDDKGMYWSLHSCAVHPGSMVNHSNRPNLKFDVVQLDLSDPDGLLPGIPTLRALRNILSAEELFVNYGHASSFASSFEKSSKVNAEVTCKQPPNQWKEDAALVKHHLDMKWFFPVNIETSNALCGRNLSIELDGGLRLIPEPSFGVFPFHLKDLKPLSILEQLLLHNYQNPRPIGSECVGLLASLGGIKANGYSSYYSSIAALAGNHDAHQQAIRTAQVNKAGLSWLLKHPDIGSSLTVVLAQVLEILGLDKNDHKRCCGMHCLAQDHSSHAEFGLHVDNLEVKGLSPKVLTCVVQLSVTPTAMRMWLFKEGYVYTGRGAGCIFHGAAIHAGAITTPPPPANYLAFKIVFFIQ